MLLKPLITEKSLAAGAVHRYSFVVGLLDTKSQIKKMVEDTFKVNVLAIHTSHVHGKSYRTGKKGIRAEGKDSKKATVTVKSDQKIELFDSPETK